MRSSLCVFPVTLPLWASPTGALAGPIPMISDVLTCGRTGIADRLAPGVQMQRADIDLGVFPDALCNDGTAAVIYFRPFLGPANRSRWVIQLQGG